MAIDWSILNRIGHLASGGYGSADSAFALSPGPLVGGYAVLPAAMDGETIPYFAVYQNADEYEVGSGVYSHAGRLLMRSDTDVVQSSNGGNRVGFSGEPVVAVDWTGELFATLDTLLDVTGDGTPQGARVALGVSDADIQALIDASIDGQQVSGDAGNRLTIGTDNGFFSPPAATPAQGANADTAFGWGDHSSEGYLLVETDPVASAALTAHEGAASPHSGHLIAVQAGPNTTVDNADPQRPVVAANDTDLAVENRTATTLDVASSSGVNATVPEANATEAGLMTAAHQVDVAALDTAAYTPVGNYATAAQGANADEAHGWGDHGLSGYLTTETDPVASAALVAHEGAGTPHSGHLISVQAGANVTVDNADPQRPVVAASAGGAATFLGLTDSPASYVGQAGKLVKVDPGETTLIFGDPSGASVAWGSVSGTLSDQDDLQTALDGKSGTGHSHVLSSVTDAGTAAAADVGTAIGDVVGLEDVGGNPAMPAVDGSQLTGITATGNNWIHANNGLDWPIDPKTAAEDCIAIGSDAGNLINNTCISIGSSSDGRYRGIAVGTGAYAIDYSTAVGHAASASVSYSVVFGSTSNSAGSGGVAIGANAQVDETGGISIGWNSSSRRAAGLVIGQNGEIQSADTFGILLRSSDLGLRVNDDGSVETTTDYITWNPVGAGGGSSDNWVYANQGNDFATTPASTGVNSLAIGDAASATTNAIAIGPNADATVSDTIAIGNAAIAQSDTHIVIGGGAEGIAGTSILLRASQGALRVLTDGSVESSDNGGTTWSPVGGGAAAPNNWLHANDGFNFTVAPITTGANSIALGNSATAGDHDQAIAIGNNASLTGDYAVAIGGQTTAAIASVAIGWSNTAFLGSVVIGQAASTTDEDGIAIGTVATAQDGVAIGRYADSGSFAIAIGEEAEAPDPYSIAIGYQATGQVLSDSKILLRTPNAAMRVTPAGALQTSSDGGTIWNTVGGGSTLHADLTDTDTDGHPGSAITITAGVLGNAVAIAADGSLVDSGVPPGGAGGTTDLAIANRTATTLDVTSSSGQNATVPEANATEAGLMTAAHQVDVAALDTAAYTPTTDYATAAQGANADTAHGWGDHSIAGYLTTVSWGDVTGKPSTFPPESHDADHNAHNDLRYAAIAHAAGAGDGVDAHVTSGQKTAWDAKLGAVEDDTAPVLGADLTVGGASTNKIVFTDGADVEIGSIGYASALTGVGFGYTEGGVFDEVDGGVLLQPGKVFLYGSQVVANSLQNTDSIGYRDVRVTNDGVLYDTPSAAYSWQQTDSGTDVVEVPDGTPSAWVEIPGLGVTLAQDVATDDVLDITANIYIVNNLGNRDGTISFGIGVGGADPANAHSPSLVSSGFSGIIAAAFKVIGHGGLITGQELTVFVRRESESHSAFDPWVDGSTGTAHTIIVGVAGATGGAPSVNLGASYTATTMTTTNTAGADAVYNAATQSVAGVLSAADKTALDTVQTDLVTHQTSDDHDARYYTQTQQDVTDSNQNTAIADKWGSGSTVDYWITDLDRGGAGTYPVADGLTLRITNTGSGVVNFTHAALSAAEAISLAIKFLVVTGDVPQWQVNGTPLNLTGLPTFEDGKLHLLTVDITSSGSVIAGSAGLVVT